MAGSIPLTDKAVEYIVGGGASLIGTLTLLVGRMFSRRMDAIEATAKDAHEKAAEFQATHFECSRVRHQVAEDVIPKIWDAIDVIREKQSETARSLAFIAGQLGMKPQ